MWIDKIVLVLQHLTEDFTNGPEDCDGNSPCRLPGTGILLHDSGIPTFENGKHQSNETWAWMLTTEISERWGNKPIIDLIEIDLFQDVDIVPVFVSNICLFFWSGGGSNSGFLSGGITNSLFFLDGRIAARGNGGN